MRSIDLPRGVWAPRGNHHAAPVVRRASAFAWRHFCWPHSPLRRAPHRRRNFLQRRRVPRFCRHRRSPAPRRTTGRTRSWRLSKVAIEAGAAWHAPAGLPQTFRGDDLVALARLCSLGQQWSSVTAAAKQYIDSTDTPKPLLAQAYGLEIDAALHIRDEAAALAASHAMLAAVPYDTTVDEAAERGTALSSACVHAVDALTLYAEREPPFGCSARGTAGVEDRMSSAPAESRGASVSPSARFMPMASPSRRSSSSRESRQRRRQRWRISTRRWRQRPHPCSRTMPCRSQTPAASTRCSAIPCPRFRSPSRSMPSMRRHSSMTTTARPRCFSSFRRGVRSACAWANRS